MPALFETYSRLTKQGHSVQVVLPPFNVFDPTIKNEDKDGTQSLRMHRFYLPRGLLDLLEKMQRAATETRIVLGLIRAVKVGLWTALFSCLGLRKAAQVARIEGADIVIGHTYLGMFPAFALARRLGVPSVARIHGTNESSFALSPSTRSLVSSPELFSLRLPMNRFVIDDDGTRGDHVARAAGVPPSRIALIPNAVDREALLESHDRVHVRKLMGIDPSAIVIITVSRLASWKRVDRMVIAMSKITRGRKVVCMVIGDGPEKALLLRLARLVHEEDRVNFVGAVDHDKIGLYFAISDIFVSTNDLTNFCIPLLEAMTCGKCVVTLNNGGTSRLIQNRKNGILLEPSAVERLPLVINELIENLQLRESLGRNAKEFAKDNILSWDARAKLELGLYSDLLHREIKNSSPTVS